MDPMREMQLAGVLPEAPDPAVERSPSAGVHGGVQARHPAAVERAREPGGVGAILRREGLYSSTPCDVASRSGTAVT